MNVAFLAHRFPVPFLSGWDFYRRYSQMAGGPAEYFANLFSQTYSRHWAGVLAFTLLTVAAWAIARGILRRFWPGSGNWPAAVFPIALLILASRDIAISYVLPTVAGLAAAWLYLALRERPRDPRAQSAVAAVFLLASFPVYYLLAAGFLYLCAIAALFELLVRRSPLWCLAWMACAAAVPYGTSYVFYEPDLAARYFRWLMPPEHGALTNAILVSAYLFVPVAAAVMFCIGKLRSGRRFGPRLRLALHVAGFAMLAVLASRLVVLHFDTSGWVYADYLLDDERPGEAVDALAQTQDDSDPVRFLTAYALARDGRLLSEMFHYPQQASSDALLLRDIVWDTNQYVADWRSDLNLSLGRVNDSQRWIHEALAMEGETAPVLERMALVHILNGNVDTAKVFLRALEKVPFQEQRALYYMTALDRDPAMNADPQVARIRPLMLTRDYIGDFSTEEILEQCLNANPSNRMAFDYLVAHYLLTSDMEGFARVASRLKDFYGSLPAHVKEALLGFRNVNGELPPGIDASAIDPQTEARFQTFVQIWTRVQNGPAENAWEALAPGFGQTYWFFYIFGRTSAGPPFRVQSPEAPKPYPAPQQKGSPL